MMHVAQLCTCIYSCISSFARVCTTHLRIYRIKRGGKCIMLDGVAYLESTSAFSTLIRTGIDTRYYMEVG